MSINNDGDNTGRRPKPLHASRSFTRLEPTPRSPGRRLRASTIQGSGVPDIMLARTSEEGERPDDNDIFARKENGRISGNNERDDSPAFKMPERFEDLPIEIRSLTERFLESLSAKVHPTPLTIDALSDLFQDFYTRAESQIASHIALLSSRISRSNTSLSQASIKSGKSGSRKDGSETPTGEQQMLTASEISDRKKKRRMLDLKRAALEEAVERAVCEKVYDRIYRHRSAEDEERDQKLRSRTAALSLIGIRLKELLVTTDDVTDELREQTAENEALIQEWLSEAKRSIQQMNEERCPYGKIQHLLASYKYIVETLSRLFPSSSSADEILPTLIYTLIISPPDTLNVISNINFIQRFRGKDKLSGEAQYCLVTLEAATSFLETVDLSSLRSDEAPSGPEKAQSGRSTPRVDTTPMRLGITPATDPLQAPADGDSASTSAKPLPSPGRPPRRLSQLIQSQTNRLEAASDTLRTTVLDASDQAFDTINNALENSFKFLFGRLHEQSEANEAESPYPKTLEEARKMISTPPPERDEENASVSGGSSIADFENGDDNTATTNATEKDQRRNRPADRIAVDLSSSPIAGARPMVRDPSVDSTRSGGSGKRVAFAEKLALGSAGAANNTSLAAMQANSGAPTPPLTAGNAAVESMRNLGNTLNPLNRFGGFGVFGRAGTPSSTPGTTTPNVDKGKSLPAVPEALLAARKEELAARMALEKLRQTKPPNRRFLEMKEAREMKLGEVEELLREYQRLALAIRTALTP